MAVPRVAPRRILNCVPSRGIGKDWLLEHAVGANLLGTGAAVPETKDLRSAWWSIGDQGQTGSCVGWAAADSVLRWHFVKGKRLETATRLSPRYVWMAAKETDEFATRPTTFVETEGTSLKAALDIARKFGSALDADLPFGDDGLYPGDLNTFYARASKLRIASYYRLAAQPPIWRRWLAQQGPILVRLEVDATWRNADMTRGRLDRYQADSVEGGHAAALVGYTRDRFIVRNSWGRAWGDKGFAYASLPYARDAFTEAYGVAI